MLYFFGARKVFVVENRSFSYKTDCDTVWDQKKVIGRFWNLPWGDFTLLGTLLFHYLGYIDIFCLEKNLMVIESFSSCFRAEILIER